METYANEIHYLAMRFVKVTAILNLLNILYDIVIFAKPDWEKLLPDWIGFLQTIISIGGSILFGISTTIAALYGSKTVTASTPPPTTQPTDTTPHTPRNRRQSIVLTTTEPTSTTVDSKDSCRCCCACLRETWLSSVLYQLYLRWEQTHPKEKALRVNQVMEAVILPHVSPLYDSVYAFRETIRAHMLSRMGLSGILNLMTTIFFYYNALIYSILYSGPTILKLAPSSTRLLYLMLNVINPVVCLAISYVVVLCDNFNSLVVYAREVSGLLSVSVDQLERAKQTIHRFTERIEKPLVRQLWAED